MNPCCPECQRLNMILEPDRDAMSGNAYRCWWCGFKIDERILRDRILEKAGIKIQYSTRTPEEQARRDAIIEKFGIPTSGLGPMPPVKP